MDELQFKNKLAEALREPSVPPDLVEKTVARVRTLEKGLAAERRLRDGQIPPGEERVSLLADSVLGRLARSGGLPLGADTEAVKGRLLHDRSFLGLTAKDPKAVLDVWDNEKLGSEILHEKSTTPAKTMTKPHGPSMGHR